MAEMMGMQDMAVEVVVETTGETAEVLPAAGELLLTAGETAGVMAEELLTATEKVHLRAVKAVNP